MFSNLTAWHLVALLIYPALIALGLWLLYSVIRLAVRKALRQHQEWLDVREPKTLPVP